MSDANTPPSTVIQIDIISDVMCPWCIVGFKQLEMALAQTRTGARVRWHPFELNPDMPMDGENLGDHIKRKYGSTEADSAQNRQHICDLGSALGFAFNFSDDSRIVNSFDAHVLLDFAATKGLQHPLKLALFAAHFTESRNIADRDVLIAVGQSIGLDPAQADQALNTDTHAKAVRAQQAVWAQNGISGVPTMIFDEKYLISGAQGPQNYAKMIQKVQAEAV
ncbi:MAG: DsbA family oxidoreductase [Pseudomonadota bacterium]